MKAFSTSEGIIPRKMEKENWCQLYLQVITIANLETKKGDFISGSWMNGA